MKTNTKIHRSSQRGAAHLAVVLACIVIVGVFAIGWTINGRQPKEPSEATTASRGKAVDQPAAQQSQGRWIERPGGPDSRWIYEGGTAPDCPQPLLRRSPSAMNRATDIGLPGQYRGTHYKAHGGIRFDGSKADDISVSLPMDATLVHLKRYIESDELQYLLDFEHPCGIRIRFDHLAVLHPDFEKIADTTPPASTDTRSVPNPQLFGQKFKAGTTVATAVGLPRHNNIGYDFGLYDLRQLNPISKNAEWAALHKNESSQTFYAVCWLPLIPAEQSKQLKALYGSNYSNKYISDYCDDAPGGSTMQYNAGKP